MPRSPLALGKASGRSRPINPARLVNLYAEPAPANSVSPWILFGTPGQKAFTTAGSEDIRCGLEALGALYVLSGTTVYQIQRNGTATACTGATPASTGSAMMKSNGVQIGLLVNGRLFYIAAAAPTVVVEVTDAQYPADGASSFDFINGYGAFTKAATDGEWFLSDSYDFSAFDAADFATAESAPDGLRRGLANHNEMWLFGTDTTEVWAGSASVFPFDPIPGSLMDRGIAAPLSAALMDNSVFWLGDDRIIYRANGYTPQRISDFAVEELLRSGTVDDAEASTHAIGGHHFYVLRLPTLDRTIVYDAATNLWHERQSGTSVIPAAWDVLCIFTAYGKTLVGLADGVIRELDLDTYLDGADQIRSAIVSYPAYPGGPRAILREVELECELGVGLPTGQGSDPQWMLRFSRDGGMTYGNEKWASVGAAGARRARCTWHQLGMFRNGAVEISCSDPVKRAIYGGRYEVEGLLQ
ncbi:MAG: hypothetical protein K0R61_66 [Microvirga sp.]|nr:hypothetical protein [Microvirga sp.]MDF2969616.1 hypothetical protein [Microvirga sp.]